ncbi:MAG TPA: hypothetical protein PLG59_14490 [bacterium]|nr:hypothetical protein [bacterium]HQO35868.1 hypothetical protein [bacterium]HQP98131.1 hypothetical protein [bacterium]
MRPALLRSIVIGIFLGTCACLLIRPFWSHDTWWHIQCGKLILGEWTWPSPDRFTCTVNGQPWLVHSWIGQCVFYLADLAMGDAGLQLLDTVTRLGFVCLVWFACRKAAISSAIRLLILANAAFFCATLEFRPHLVVPVFLAVMVLSECLRTPGRPVPLWTIPLMTLWSNTHPSILLGEFYLAMCLVQRWVAHGKPQWNRDTLVLFAAMLAGFLNPYHFRLIPFSLFENRAYQYVTINEWLSPLTQLPQSWSSVLILLASAAVFILLLLRNLPCARHSEERSDVGISTLERTGLRSPHPGPSQTQGPGFAMTESRLHFLSQITGSTGVALRKTYSRSSNFSHLIYLLCLCVFVVISFSAFRFMFLSTIAILPLLSVLPSSRVPLPPGEGWVEGKRFSSLLLIGYLLLLILNKPVYSRDWFDLKNATAFLNEIHAEGNIFNDFSFGGRIIYDCYPRLKVFADGRIGPFEKKIFPLYEEVFRGTRDRAMEILDRYRIDWILIQEVRTPQWMKSEKRLHELYRRSGIVIFRLGRNGTET